MESKPLLWAAKDYIREVNARVAPNVAPAVIAGTLAGLLACLPYDSQHKILLALESACESLRSNN